MFGLKVQWDLEHFLGYLGSWSAVQHYKDKNGVDPVAMIAEDFKKVFNRMEELEFPIFLKWLRKV